MLSRNVIGSSNDTIEILKNIKSYKVSGFELIIATADERTAAIKNGLINLVNYRIHL